LQMSNRVFESRVIDAPSNIVWEALRSVDFKFSPSFSKCEIEGNDSPFRVGSIRRVTLSSSPNAMQRYRLVQLSEVDSSASFEIVESEPPVPYSGAIHMFKLRKVTNNNTTFVEMESEFSRDAPSDVFEESRHNKIRTLDALQQFCTNESKGQRRKSQEKASATTASVQPNIAFTQSEPSMGAGTFVTDTERSTATATATPASATTSDPGYEVLPTVDQLRRTTQKDIEEEWKQFDRSHSGSLEPHEVLRVVEGLMARIAEEDSDVVTFTLNMFRPEALSSTQSLTTEFKSDLRKKQKILAQELLGKMDRNRHGKVEMCEFQALFNDWLQKKLSTLIAGAYYGFGREGHMPPANPPV